MPIPLIRDDGKTAQLHVLEMHCIVKDDKTRKIIIKNGENTYQLPSTIKELIQVLAPLGFVQIDKNKIVNVMLIDKYENGKFTIGDTVYYVSRRNKKKFELEMEKHRRPIT